MAMQIHEETYGKSGCRRVVPGQYLAADPKGSLTALLHFIFTFMICIRSIGRAVMIGAIEKQKLVYVLNRDAAANLTISSPLEAHKSHTLIFSTPSCVVFVLFVCVVFPLLTAF